MTQSEITCLFYDKYLSNHSFNNISTCSITVDDIQNDDTLEKKSNLDAITYYNLQFPNFYTIPVDLDLNFYTPTIYFRTTNTGSTELYTVIEIENDKIEKVYNGKTNIPNESFFEELCRYHLSYDKRCTISKKNNSQLPESDKQKIKERQEQIRVNAMTPVKYSKPDLEVKGLKIELFNYQKDSIRWMLELEQSQHRFISSKICLLSVKFGNIYYDLPSKKFTEDKPNIIKFHGGGVIDEVGLGKTLITSSIALLNPPSSVDYFALPEKVSGKSTLIICPSQLCGQWERELKNYLPKNRKIININSVFLTYKI